MGMVPKRSKKIPKFEIFKKESQISLDILEETQSTHEAEYLKRIKEDDKAYSTVSL